VAICHRSELRVYDRTGTGSYTVLPASGLGFSTSLGGGGFLSAEVESRLAAITGAPTLLDDCVIKLALPLTEPGTTFTEVLAYANRARNGTLWAGAGAQTRQIRQAPSLFTVWSQDAILHPEGNAIAQMTADKRYFGWQSTIYDPTGDGWGTPSDNEGQQDSTGGNRAGNPDGWPTELGNAYWITRGATSNGDRHLFIADCVVPTDCYLTVYWSSDESAAVYFAGSLIGQSSSSETGYLEIHTWSAWVTAGTYRVGIDKTSVVTRPGGNGRDPVLLGIATNDSDGAIVDILLVTDTDWLVYTMDPVNGEAPSLTPGAIVAELHTQAAARGVDTWSALTLGFDADVDSDGHPWPVREERDWRIAYDRHLDMLEGLGDTGFCPEITPALVLEGWSDRGTDLSATVTIAALVEADSVDESGTGVAATYMPVETEDGWVIVENATAAATYGRRETALSLGNAPSIAQGRRLGQKVLDDRLSRPETEWIVQFYATARCTPFVDFNLGDTVTIDIGGTGTPRVVLEIGGQADHTEGIIRWTIKTGDTALPARFGTQPGGALADGGVTDFIGDGGLGATFTTLGGTGTAAGGVSTFTNGTTPATFTTLGGGATAAGGMSTFINGDFVTLGGSATADGGTSTFTGDPATGDWESAAIAYDWEDWVKAYEAAAQGDMDDDGGHVASEVWQ
jgi:hypothetical protein